MMQTNQKKEQRKEKILNIVSNLLSSIDNEDLTDSEFFLVSANILFSYGLAGLKKHYDMSNINPNDATSIETLYMLDPGNQYLAAILQAHILVKWAESLDE